ncbi:MAG TPA: polysaccharide deacetylase family protein [Gemmatimonadaceae bacterium]|nr:polysaccharide deacetylase family protein [Gemmatimonadaceae bacterium]
MRARTDRRGGALSLVLVALLIVAISVAVVHWQAAARERRASSVAASTGAATVIAMPPLVAPRVLPHAIRVAIVRDPGSDHYFESKAALDSVVGGWTSLLQRIGADVAVASPADSASLRAARVLVFPSEPCLGKPARDLIRSALARGQGVVTTWITGTRDGGCAPVGWTLPARLAGAMRLDTLDTRNAVYVTVPDGGPLSTEIPPGSRMELLVANHVAARSATRDLLYTDRMMNPEPAQGAELLDGAATTARIGAGRSVYLGFDPINVAKRPWSSVLAELLARNAIQWAAGDALASVEPWPRGRLAAAMIAQDVEDEFSNAVHALDSLDAIGVRGTWYVVSQLAERNEKLLKRLARNGEVGTHTENHDVLAGQGAERQRDRLAVTQKQIAEMIGHRVAGLRPPEEQFDRNTMRAWLDAGGSYIFGANDSRSASPELLPVGSDTLLLLGRVNNDDVISVRRVGNLDVGRLTAEYLGAYEKVRALGGLFIMSYHSQYMSRPELVPVVAAVARRLAADTTVWLTTGGEAASWWRARMAARITVTTSPDGAMTVQIRNPSTLPLDGAVVRVQLPGTWRAPGASEVGGATLLAGSPTMVRLALPRLEPGAMHEVTVTLARTDAR